MRGWQGLLLTAIGTGTAVYFVHYDQNRELARMKEGVIIDAQREQFRRQVHAKRQQEELDNELNSKIYN